MFNFEWKEVNNEDMMSYKVVNLPDELKSCFGIRIDQIDPWNQPQGLRRQTKKVNYKLIIRFKSTSVNVFNDDYYYVTLDEAKNNVPNVIKTIFDDVAQKLLAVQLLVR